MQKDEFDRNLKPLYDGAAAMDGERKKSNLNVSALSEYLMTKEYLARQSKMVGVLQKDKIFDKSNNYFRSREDMLKSSFAVAKRAKFLAVRDKWTPEEQQMADYLYGEPTAYALHASMFLKTLRDQGNAEQHKLFLEPATNYDIIGCYAQTELGHGSNVRGLETTATWDPATKEFIVHSPNLTASKWWIGSLGKAANYCVAMAQLIVKGKLLGPHPFVIPIRDLKTHDPLPGVIVGDIGPKFGYNTMDNGYLLFKQVRIPHINMLGKFSRVDPNTSEYITPPNPALVYGTLTYIRATIVFQGGIMLARGATIAIRYCSVRRQFHDQDATPQEAAQSPEMAVLDYSMVQARLFPVLANTYALHFAGKTMMNTYLANQKAAEESGDFSRLADLHSKTCALKALASFLAADGLEVSRRACGGHGYSSFSGVGTAYATYLPTVTWEGDNYMLTQQVARFLLKLARSVINGKPLNDDNFTNVLTTYYKNRNAKPTLDIHGKPEDFVNAFAIRAAHITFDILKKRDQDKRDWTGLQVDFWQLSTAYSQYLLAYAFWEVVYGDTFSKSLDSYTVSIFKTLFKLHVNHTLSSSNAGADMLITLPHALIAPQQLKQCSEEVLSALKEIRPHAVRLVDAWAVPDYLLDSSLGRSDGKVYEDMWNRAHRLNPINKLVFDSDYRTERIIRREVALPEAISLSKL